MFNQLFSCINNNEKFSLPLPGLQTPITLNVKNTVSMIDGKMAGMLQGDFGSRKCHYCDSSEVDRNDPLQIFRCFSITKSYESCMEAWQKLESEEIKHNDPQRQGQCDRSLVSITNFCILHWKLRSLDFCLRILYRLVSVVYKWGRVASDTETHCIAIAKLRAQEHIRRKLGFPVDVPVPGSGNMNNGYIAQQFFDPKSRDAICDMIPHEADRENYKLLLCNINVMLSICLSERPEVNTYGLRQLGIDTMYNIRTAFIDEQGKPWIQINPSLHSMCAHSWELFEMSPEPLVVFSEQAREHWNKHLARFKSGCGTRARQHSIKENLHDILARMLRMTNPLVVNRRRQIQCSACGCLGHTARSKLHHGVAGNLSGDDSLIMALYCFSR